MPDFEQFVKTIYSKDLEEKKTWYSSVAVAYDKTRPRYPQELIKPVLELAQLPPDATILEIGCGPGTATVSFAEKGFKMVCLEPSLEACQLAQKNCQAYPKVEIKNSTFEEWQPDTEKFDAVLAATSFHWVKAEIVCSKAAEILKDDGSLILLWNTPPQPSYEVFHPLLEIYQQKAPSLAGYAGYEDLKIHQENLRKLGIKVIESGLFKNLVYEQIVCEVTYTVDDYLGLLSTLSPYIMLESQVRVSLFESLRERLLSLCGNSLQLSHISAFQITQKS
uniref:Methyltransferase type 12 n=2 Tax=Gloeothece TaxID=28070 RepID=E0UB62_GLOV7|nr:Methyltransferase type 12 [Gloeothece verrucosa PCC 7822]